MTNNFYLTISTEHQVENGLPWFVPFHGSKRDCIKCMATMINRNDPQGLIAIKIVRISDKSIVAEWKKEG